MLWLINKSGTPVKYLNKVRKIMNFIIKGYPKKSFYNKKKRRLFRDDQSSIGL